MENPITFTQLNDFVFCPASIFFHNFYNEMDKLAYQSKFQIEGTHAHKAVDSGTYSTRKNILQAIDVYCGKYGLVGKIDLYDADKKLLIERKKKIKVVYDGYIFQLYAQYFAMIEMGYEVISLRLQSIDDNKFYPVDLPEKNKFMLEKFEKIIYSIQTINLSNFRQLNVNKCQNCIYEPACDRSVL